MYANVHIVHIMVPAPAPRCSIKAPSWPAYQLQQDGSRCVGSDARFRAEARIGFFGENEKFWAVASYYDL